MIFQFFVFISAFAGLCFCDNGQFYLVYRNGNNLTVSRSQSPVNTVGVKWTAKSFLNNSMNSTGWDVLEIITNPELSDKNQAYQAGWIEGYLTQKQIYNHWYNTRDYICQKQEKTCSNIRNYLNLNLKWIKTKINSNTTDPYWHQVNLYYQQIKGLHDGYSLAAKNTNQNLTHEDILWVNYVTDLMTLQESLASKSEVKNITSKGHCSVLIKLLPGYTDVFFGHNAWISYNFMNRIIKRYNFAFHWSGEKRSKLIPGQSQAFSSYPGVITSIDDFYIINSGLFVTETTNNIYNKDLYKQNKPTGQVLESVRSAVANRLATDTHSWSYFFSRMNSGTYNNQWMIVDLKKFRPGFEPEKGFLHVLEQIPGNISSADQTQHILSYSYWASYNIPFYKNIYNSSGYNEEEEIYGSAYSHKNSPRAKIFQREQEKVVDLDSMIKTIRYNHYKTDPYSICAGCKPKQNACNAVASRCDLNPINGTYTMNNLKFDLFGAIDAKVGSYSMFKKGEMIAIGGPTTSGGLPPFQWSTAQVKNMSHLGQPDVWDFKPFTTSWLHQITPESDEQEVIILEIPYGTVSNNVS